MTSNTARISSKKPSASPQSMNEIEKQKWRCIVELHKIQEKLREEHSKNLVLREKNILLKQRLEDLLNKNPHIWEYESFVVDTSSDHNGFLICIDNAQLKNKLFASIEVLVQFTDGIAALHFLNTSTLRNQLFSEFKTSHSDKVSICPSAGSAFESSNYIISSLSTSDWEVVLELSRKILQQGQLGRIENFGPDEVHAFSIFVKALEDWPEILRFDDIESCSTLKEGSYENITLKLKNLSFGKISCNEFVFNVGTVSQDNIFDYHPRLEFFETCRGVIQAWYAESSDHRGERFEIRYSLPNAIDAFVWRQLSIQDRCLITALIYYLPVQLKQMINDSDLASRDKWLLVTSTIRRIHSQYIQNHGI
ncbi:UNVERIFIED_ORG: hypothetical protein J2W16_003410 [Pseudomonas cremoricolorata]|nr:hypothetical protein [Pseudomonas cremoricolorata]